MVFMCWFYCMPFFSFLYYASTALMLLFACFMIRRGVYRRRIILRKMGFALLFLSFAKVSLIDLYDLINSVLCLKWDICSHDYNIGAYVFCGLILAVLGYFQSRLYKIYGIDYKNEAELKDHDKEARIWASSGMAGVLIVFIWVCVSWYAHFWDAALPHFFYMIPWKLIALMTFIILISGFWALEACYTCYDPRKSERLAGVHRNWVPQDTLWLSLFLLLIVVSLGYVTDDLVPDTTNSQQVVSPRYR